MRPATAAKSPSSSFLLADLRPLKILTLDDVHVPDVHEDGATFAENAAKKAREVSLATGLAALADDSGLEVDALSGAPGVHSARYAGDERDDKRNNDKLIAALREIADESRGARFRSVLALADSRGPLGDDMLLAEGSCEGRILRERRGERGFGYDPLFHIEALGVTFAELALTEKSKISHRAQAMAAMKPKIIEYFQLAKAHPGR